MNILYIGPYRHDSTISLSSKDIIDSLCNIPSANITIRPVYLQSGVPTISDELQKLENKPIASNYDIVIQHAPIKLLCANKNLFGSNTRLICIPIMDPIINKADYAKCLVNFDLVLTDNKLIAEILQTNYGFAEKTRLYSYFGTYKSDEVVDLGVYGADLKFYFVGSFTNNRSAIELILRSFYISFRAVTNISLLLVFTDTLSNDLKKQIDDMVLSVKAKLNIAESCQREKIIVKKPSINELASLHNTCDILICLNDFSAESGFHRHICMNHKKRVIDESNVKFYYDVSKSNNEQYYFGEAKAVTNSLELSTAILESVKDNYNSDQTFPTIDQILCQ